MIIKILEEHGKQPTSSAIYLRLILFAGYHGTFQLMFLRGGIQATLSSWFIYRNRINGDESRLFGDNIYTNMILLLRTILGFLGMAFGFLAIEHMPIADASVLVMQSPILAAILGYFALGEPWRLPEFAATVISMLGVILISRPPFIFDRLGYVVQSDSSSSNANYDQWGPVYGVAAAFAAGGAFVTVRILGTTAKMV